MEVRQKEVAVRSMHHLDSVLAKQDYLTGSAFTMADITGFAGLAFADFAKIDIPQTPTHLAAWRSKIAAHPSIAI
jgi:glutathione S-transferase